MLKIAGALLLISGGLMLGLRQRAQIRSELRLIMDMDSALGFISAEIDGLRRPLPEIFEVLSFEGPESMREMFSVLSHALECESLPTLWRRELDKLGLSQELCRTVSRLGGILGRCEASVQIAETELCRKRLEELHSRIENEKYSRAGNWPKLGACLGAMLAVILF